MTSPSAESGTSARVSSISRPILPSSLNAGITTEIRMNASPIGARQMGADGKQYQAFPALHNIVHPEHPPLCQKPGMLRQLPRATISDTGYLLRLLACF